MAEGRCDWCGASDPDWVRLVDQSPLDKIFRQMGRPGPTQQVYRACDNCLPRMRASFPSEEDREAIAQARRELAELPTTEERNAQST